MHKFLLTLLGLLAALPAFAQDFDYTYEGQTYTYTVINPEERTCGIFAEYLGPVYTGSWEVTWDDAYSIKSNNYIRSREFSIVLPEHPIYEGEEYTLITLGDYALNANGHIHDWDSEDKSFPTSKILPTLKSLTIPPSVKSIGKIFGVSVYDSYSDCMECGYTVDAYYMPRPEEVCVSSLEHWLALDWDCHGYILTVNGEKDKISGDIVIPEGVEKICANKFSGNTLITSVTIPNSVTSIGYDAFKGCSGLTKIEIEDLAKWYEIDWRGTPSSILPLDHVIFQGTEIPVCPTGDLVLPEGTSRIGNSAFYGCSGLTSVTIPGSVTSIGEDAFYGCSGLTSVTIPGSVTSIGSSAFYSCYGLTEVHVSDLGAWCNINFLGWEYSTPLYYAHHLFLNDEEVKDLVIPNSVTKIGEYAFYGCSGLTSVTIPNSVTSIGRDAFKGCSGLTEVHISDLGAWCNIQFWGYETNPLYYAHHLFLNGEEVKDLVIPNSVTSIGQYAFYGCSGIVKAAYPNTHSNPFSSSNSSAKLICYNANSTISLPESGALYDESANSLLYVPTNVSSITIPEDTKYIGPSAFYACDNLQEIIARPFVTPPTIASDNFTEEQYENVRLIIPDGTYARYINSQWKNFKNIEVAKAEGDDNRFFDGVFSYSYSLNTKEATLIPGDYAAMTNAQIPNRIAAESEEGTTFYNVTGIADGAFMNCKNLTTVKLPKNLARIGDSAFQGCSALEAVSIPETVEEIGEYAFSGCSGLRTATLPSALTEINDFLFMDCSNLETVNFPETLQRIGQKAFSKCSSLTSIYLPEGLTEVGWGPFFSCSSLTSVSIPNSLTEIGASMFSCCDGLTEIIIPNSVTKIGDYTFSNCSGLTSVTIPNSVTEIGQGAFSNCSGLTSVTIPNSVTKIGDYAFRSCTGLTSVSIPNSVTEIGLCAFEGCTGLTSVTIPNSVTYIGDSAFYGCPSLKSAEIADSHLTLTIDFNIFKYCPLNNIHIGRPWISKNQFIPTTLETLTLGNTVTEIPDKAFANLPNLTSVSFGGALESIGEQAFSGCNLQEVVIPPSVTFIGAEAFSGNSDLAEIKIGHGIEEIGERAFADCNNIANIYVTATNPPSAQNNTFSNYSSPLWLPDEETFDRYYNYPRCWYRFEDNMFTLKPVESLSTINNELTGNPGESIKIEVTVEPADATLPQIFWSSSDPSVATVDHEGNVTFTTETNDGISTLSDDEAEPKPIVKSCTITARSMHAEVPMLEITLNKTIGDEIVEISTPEIPADQDAPIEVYNLRGVKVSTSTDGLTPGIYIIRQGNKSRKVAI